MDFGVEASKNVNARNHEQFSHNHLLFIELLKPKHRHFKPKHRHLVVRFVFDMQSAFLLFLLLLLCSVGSQVISNDDNTIMIGGDDSVLNQHKGNDKGDGGGGKNNHKGGNDDEVDKGDSDNGDGSTSVPTEMPCLRPSASPTVRQSSTEGGAADGSGDEGDKTEGSEEEESDSDTPGVLPFVVTLFSILVLGSTFFFLMVCYRKLLAYHDTVAESTERTSVQTTAFYILQLTSPSASVVPCCDEPVAVAQAVTEV